jgi:hypothetical protein
MEAVSSSEMLVNIYQIKRRHIPFFYLYDRGSTFHRKVGKLVRGCMAAYRNLLSCRRGSRFLRIVSEHLPDYMVSRPTFLSWRWSNTSLRKLWLQTVTSQKTVIFVHYRFIRVQRVQIRKFHKYAVLVIGCNPVGIRTGTVWTYFGLPSWEGRAIAQAVSRRLPTAAAWVRAQVRSCGISGGQSGTGAGFLRVLRLPLPIRIPPIVPQSSSSSIIWGWYNRPSSGCSTKWTQCHLMRKIKKNTFLGLALIYCKGLLEHQLRQSGPR